MQSAYIAVSVVACFLRAMGDFMMRESQPVAFRVSWELDASYTSYATEDGKEMWGAAPKSSVDSPNFDEVYIDGKLQPPSDPASVLIRRPHSFPMGVSSHLLPPHPKEIRNTPNAGKQLDVKQQATIGVHLYAPITCAEASLTEDPPVSLLPCQRSQRELLSLFRQAQKVDGVSSFSIEVEVLQLTEEGKGGTFHQNEASVCSLRS